MTPLLPRDSMMSNFTQPRRRAPRKAAAQRFIYIVRWGNPYTQPPNGQPVELGRMTVNGKPTTGAAPGCPAELLRLHVPGSGYSVYVARIPEPIRHWSPERKFAYRRKRLESRLRKKYPLFAEQMITEAMHAKPDYYGVAP